MESVVGTAPSQAMTERRPERSRQGVSSPSGQPVVVGTNLGRLYLDQGHLDEARAVFEAVLANDPGNAGAREGLVAVEARERESSASPIAPPVASPDVLDPTARKVAALKAYLARLERRRTAQA